MPIKLYSANGHEELNSLFYHLLLLPVMVYSGVHKFPVFCSRINPTSWLIKWSEIFWTDLISGINMGAFVVIYECLQKAYGKSELSLTKLYKREGRKTVWSTNNAGDNNLDQREHPQNSDFPDFVRRFEKVMRKVYPTCFSTTANGEPGWLLTGLVSHWPWLKL